MGGERSGRGFVGRHLVELGIQDIADALVGTDTGRQGAAASGFQARLCVALAENREYRGRSGRPVGDVCEPPGQLR